MQKRSHAQLASALLRELRGFSARRFEWAFWFGSFQPDCNPLSYLKGSLSASRLRGHHYPNSRRYINTRILRLQRRSRWTIWQYYTLGKLTHYLADAFTYPHNANFSSSLLDHRRYEGALRSCLEEHLSQRRLRRTPACRDLVSAIEELHRQYMAAGATMQRDVQYITQATALLMAACRPAAAESGQSAHIH